LEPVSLLYCRTSYSRVRCFVDL